jgi:hypothetical protein
LIELTTQDDNDREKRRCPDHSGVFPCEIEWEKRKSATSYFSRASEIKSFCGLL